MGTTNDRSQQIIRTSWIGIIANVLLAGFKAVVGILSSLIAIIMDAVNNLSDALIASGSDALFDAIITLATLISAGVMLLWGVSLDGILGTLISLVIIKAGVEMLASPINELLGTSIPAELTNEIKKEVSNFEDVHGVYDLILHNYGPDVKIGSLHINVYDTMSAHDIHGLTRKITTQMFDHYGIIMTVGVYAIATGENRRTELQSTVMQTLSYHQDVVQVHGFYYSEKDKMLSVDVVPDISVHMTKLLLLADLPVRYSHWCLTCRWSSL